MKIAVYGTLRRGEGNWSYFLKGRSAYLKTAVISGFRMVTNGAYPYAIEFEGNITVDLFEIDEDTLERLDYLEGYPSHYNRKLIDVGDDQAWIYYTENKEFLKRYAEVPSGDWLVKEAV